MDAAQGGDERAFSALWRWLNPPLVRWLAVTAPDGGDDVASEVWVSIIRGLDVFEGDERAFRGWAFTIARRRAIDWGRRRRRRRDVPLSDGVDRPGPSDASEAVSEATAVEAAVALLRSLNPDQAELTVAETAAVVEKSEGAVRVMCHRGLRALERHIAADVQHQV